MTVDSTRNNLIQMQGRLADAIQAGRCAYDALKKTAESPSRVATAFTTAGLGAYQVAQGNFISGAVCTAIGMKEIWNIFSSENTGALDKILADAAGTADAMKMFQKDIKGSIQKIDHHLGQASGSIKSMEALLKEIDYLNTQGMEELEAFKADLQEQCKQSIAALNQDVARLQDAKNALTGMKHDLSKNQATVKELRKYCLVIKSKLERNEITESDAQTFKNQLDGLRNIAENHRKSEEQVRLVEGTLNSVAESLSKNIERQLAAIKSSSESLTRLEKILKNSKNTIDKLEAQNQKAKTQIKEAQNECERLKRANHLMDKTIDELQNQIKEAANSAAYTASFSEILIGGGGAALGAAALGAGTAGMFTAPLVGTLLVKNRSTLKKMSNFLFRRPSDEPEVQPSKESVVTAEFNKQSTGYWNHYVLGKTQSTTIGKVGILLPNGQKFETSFDLNRSKDKITMQDSLTLVKALRGCLEANPNSAESCLEVVRSLKTYNFNVAGRAKGLIRESSPLFDYFENLCIETIEQNAKEHN